MRRVGILSLAVLALVLTAFTSVQIRDVHRETVAREAAVAREIAVLTDRAQAGDGWAQVALGDRLRQGTGVSQNPEEAAAWYRKAAHRGIAQAAAALGEMLEAGEGGAPDPARAAEWYAAAIRLGARPEAYYALGRMYLYGRGIARDVAEAHALLIEAARRGHPEAQYLAGTMAEAGLGTDADRVEAYKWYRLVQPHRDRLLAEDGRYDPDAGLERLSRVLNRQQIREAEAMARSSAPGR